MRNLWEPYIAPLSRMANEQRLVPARMALPMATVFIILGFGVLLAPFLRRWGAAFVTSLVKRLSGLPFIGGAFSVPTVTLAEVVIAAEQPTTGSGAERPIDSSDVEALAEILTAEMHKHARTRGLCFGLFLFTLVLLILAVVVFGLVFINRRSNGLQMDQWLPTLQLLPPLSAAVIGFFGSWWATQNCINSIERTLFAARASRTKLFAAFLGNLQCVNKKKRLVWMEMAASLIG